MVKGDGLGMKFLILENNERITKIYQKFFDTKNFPVEFAKDENMCFEKFASAGNYDYIILEKSTKMGNLSLEEKIREINPLQKILFLESFMTLENSEISLETQYLVEKPFAMVTLLGKIQMESIQPIIKVK